MLRIDVDGTNGPGGNYGIPDSNPFVDAEGDDEIWAYGLRNPWRNAFDRVTGDLYLADVGAKSWEEINFQPASSAGGENWGWPCRQGAHDFNLIEGCESATLIDPIYEHAYGPPPCAIIGGEVYRGCAVPDLLGTYFFGDYCSAQIWSLEVQDGLATNVLDRTAELEPPGALSIDAITSFGQDAYGEIYIVDPDGEVFKIVPTESLASCPQAVPATSMRTTIALSLALLAAGWMAAHRTVATRHQV